MLKYLWFEAFSSIFPPHCLKWRDSSPLGIQHPMGPSMPSVVIREGHWSKRKVNEGTAIKRKNHLVNLDRRFHTQRFILLLSYPQSSRNIRWEISKCNKKGRTKRKISRRVSPIARVYKSYESCTQTIHIWTLVSAAAPWLDRRKYWQRKWGATQ